MHHINVLHVSVKSPRFWVYHLVVKKRHFSCKIKKVRNKFSNISFLTFQCFSKFLHLDTSNCSISFNNKCYLYFTRKSNHIWHFIQHQIRKWALFIDKLIQLITLSWQVNGTSILTHLCKYEDSIHSTEYKLYHKNKIWNMASTLF